jgi:putative membrane-bound dehydrogenase-like protein
MVARYILATTLLIASSLPSFAASPPHVVLMIGEREYDTARTLPAWFAEHVEPLGMRCTVIHVPADGQAAHDFHGIETALDAADLLIVSVRRRAPREAQLAAIRRHLENGKPLLGIRTASHAFDARGDAPDGHAEWLKFDEQVLGAAYQGHYGDEPFRVQVVAGAEQHPILRGVRPWKSSKLYKGQLRSAEATGLLQGAVKGEQTHPIAWTSRYGPHQARVFYTSLGLPGDFQQPGFLRLLTNGLLWTLDREIPGATEQERAEQDEAAIDVVSPPKPYVLKRSDQESSLNVLDDLELELVLREPTVANPLYLSFDERGRLWVVQYRQYPWPAGLKLLSRDNVWRNVYDPPFPPPPPHAADSPFRGADRITIHVDHDRDGTYDEHKVFLDGLNFATAALVGRGGVYVMNPPYLLFYADRDQDDRPDSLQPQILLSGFGIEDSHSIANSLRWGPDGWIYATQGSTVSGSVVVHGPDGQPLPHVPPVHSLGQNVWRYHPESRRYEVFAEGGGNAFGVEIDAKGRVYSGHNGGDTRGFYYVQGGYSQKNFGKHGQLSNPYAFAYYSSMRHHPVVRFTHTFTIYEADALPSRFHGRLFGVNPVEHHVVLSDIGPDGASRRTEDVTLAIEAGEGEQADWFTPVDIQLAPDGSLYVADWYSVQPNHYRNHEGQTNPDLGRIYRLRAPTHPSLETFDLGKLTSDELIDQYLTHPNRWFRQQSLRLLADRRDVAVVPRLSDMVTQSTEQKALDALWALHLSGGLGLQPQPLADHDPSETNGSDASVDGVNRVPSVVQLARIEALLRHPDPHVRRWTVRLLGDFGSVPQPLWESLGVMARTEADVEARLQLAASSRFFPAELGVPLLYSLMDHAADAQDIYIPNMIWWSLESHHRRADLLLQGLQASERWRSPFRIDGYSIPQNVMRRFAMAGRQQDLLICERLLKVAPDNLAHTALVEAFVAAFAGRSLPSLPDGLASQLARAEGPFALLLKVRQRQPGAVEEALERIADASLPSGERVELIRAVGDVQEEPQKTIDALLNTFRQTSEADVQCATLVSLQKFTDPNLGNAILDRYSHLPSMTQAVARQVLASRATWASPWLKQLQDGTLSASEVEPEIVQRLRRHRDVTIQSTLAKLFPSEPTDNAAREAMIDAFEQIVRQGQGDPLRGRELFANKAQCAKCHRLFASGEAIGPDLTSYNRTNLRRMLLAIVHPSAEVREGFESFTAITTDGRVLAGLKVEQHDHLVVLRGTDGQNQTIPTGQLDELIQDERSLMPDGLLDELSESELCDLFAYLTSTTPPQ